MSTLELPFHDVAIIGAGIVGASTAWHLTRTSGLRVLLLEAESVPGYHSTGRSAAVYAPSYGPPQVRALTRASGEFLLQPPPGFAAQPLVRARPSLFVADAAGVEALTSLHGRLVSEGLPARLLSTEEALALVPALRPQACERALLDRSSSDIDVDALLQGFLRGARAAGLVLATEARVQQLQRTPLGWHIRLDDGRQLRAHRVVNAAGAWADELATLAGARRVGLQPCRRSAFVFEAAAGVATDDWPCVIAADESWYIKPDAGLLLGSPANADPVPPHDVVAEELDVALGIHRIEQATTLQIRRPRRTWAGLRSFVADGEPVIGPDLEIGGFFWAAALGGYGIQTSPAVGQLVAALLRDERVPAELAHAGVSAASLGAARLRQPPTDSGPQR